MVSRCYGASADVMTSWRSSASSEVLANASRRTEIQLLKYRQPLSVAHPDAYSHTRLGFHHICFAVDDIEAEIDRFCANGVPLLNHVMDFHDRKLVFLTGPEGIVVELSEWHGAS